jgi:hypothetical protein
MKYKFLSLLVIILLLSNCTNNSETMIYKRCLKNVYSDVSLSFQNGWLSLACYSDNECITAILFPNIL